jgi:hypothetical protein
VTLQDIPLRQEIILQQGKIRDAMASRQETLAERLWRTYLLFTEDSLVAAMDASGRAGGRAAAR